MTEDANAMDNGTYDVHMNFHYTFQNKDYINKARALGFEQDLVKKPLMASIVAKPK
jgi:acetate kinase